MPYKTLQECSLLHRKICK